MEITKKNKGGGITLTARRGHLFAIGQVFYSG